jgi:hypothetical protein
MLRRCRLVRRHLAMILLLWVNLVRIMLVMRLLVLLMIMRLIASGCMIEWACIKSLSTR